jgi:oligopeptidase B
MILDNRRFRATALFLMLAGIARPQQIDSIAAKPPFAEKQPKSINLHGDTWTDDYFWLREKTNPKVKAYLDAENAYADAILKPTAPFQEKLYAEMLGRVKQTDSTVPARRGDYWYYSRTEEGKQYAIRCRKRGSLDAKEEIILDENELAKDQKFFSLGIFSVSDDHQLLAYSTDLTGFREYVLYVKDLRTGERLPDQIAKIDSATWASDSRTLLYVTEDDAKRAFRLNRHVLGSMADDVVYEEKDPLFVLGVSRSHDRKYVWATSESSTTSEARWMPADRPTDEPRIVLPREEGHRYDVDHREGRWYIRTDKDAKNGRIVSAPVDAPIGANWKEMLPHRPDVLIEGMLLFANHCVVAEYEAGLPFLRVIDLRTGDSHRLAHAEPVYSVSTDSNPEFQTATLRFHYESLVTPDSIYEYDMDAKATKLLKQAEVKNHDPSRYTSERIQARAADGTNIPISVVYRKGLEKNGQAPCLLYGYGAYGASETASFDSNLLSLLDRGAVYAVAHVRGGKEMGEIWHEQGKMLQKKNSFTDFIACADHLVAEKYASRKRLVIEGASAGGLLVGAVVTMRPDVCHAAVLEVPFVDVINTMLDETLPLTVQEFLEWGNPKKKDEYVYMKSYCPYSNIQARDYPSMLVRTSLNDSQVMYWEPAKFVAKMRAMKTDRNPLLFTVNMDAGHGGSSGRYHHLREYALTYAFILGQMGLNN